MLDSDQASVLGALHFGLGQAIAALGLAVLDQGVDTFSVQPQPAGGRSRLISITVRPSPSLNDVLNPPPPVIRVA